MESLVFFFEQVLSLLPSCSRVFTSLFSRRMNRLCAQRSSLAELVGHIITLMHPLGPEQVWGLMWWTESFARTNKMTDAVWMEWNPSCFDARMSSFLKTFLYTNELFFLKKNKSSNEHFKMLHQCFRTSQPKLWKREKESNSVVFQLLNTSES